MSKTPKVLWFYNLVQYATSYFFCLVQGKSIYWVNKSSYPWTATWFMSYQTLSLVKYRAMSQALGSEDLTLDQSATSILILLRSPDTLFIKLQLYHSFNSTIKCTLIWINATSACTGPQLLLVEKRIQRGFQCDLSFWPQLCQATECL